VDVVEVVVVVEVEYVVFGVYVDVGFEDVGECGHVVYVEVVVVGVDEVGVDVEVGFKFKDKDELTAGRNKMIAVIGNINVLPRVWVRSIEMSGARFRARSHSGSERGSDNGSRSWSGSGLWSMPRSMSDSMSRTRTDSMSRSGSY